MRWGMPIVGEGKGGGVSGAVAANSILPGANRAVVSPASLTVA